MGTVSHYIHITFKIHLIFPNNQITHQYLNMSSNEVVGDTASARPDADYVSRPDQSGEPVPVVKDGAVDSGVNAATADSDEQLAKDDKEAIDSSNIIEERTRGATKE